MTSLLPVASIQFIDANGAPLSGGLVSYFVPNTLTYKNTYQDVLGTILNENPVPLDSSGKCTVFGSGAYDMSVVDALGNLQYEGYTTSALSESAVSGYMLPLLGSGASSGFINNSGIAGFVSNAIAAIELLPGPVGPAGIQGPTGPTGATGPSGAAASTSFANGNPGYWKDNSSGFTMQFGSSTTASSGGLTLNYPFPFPSACLSCVCTITNSPTNVGIRTQVFNQVGFVVFSEDSNNNARAASFAWLAIGF